MSLAITKRQHGIVTILDLKGKIRLGEDVARFREALRESIANGQTKLLLNLAEVDFIDSSGLGELVSTHVSISRNGGQIKLANLSEKVQNLLVITKLYTVFEVYTREVFGVISFD